MKKILILGLIILVLAVGGYWYGAIYQPPRYAQAVLALETELKSFGEQVGEPQFRWRYDYETTINTLDKYDAFTAQFTKKINALNPPLFDQEMKQLKKDLQFWIDDFNQNIELSRKRIEFTRNAIELYKIFHPESTTVRETLPPEKRTAQPLPPLSQPHDLGTIVDLWKSWISAAQIYTDKMFRQEPLNLDDNTFTELKSLWEEVNRAVNTVLPELEKKFGRSKPLSSLPPPAELEKTIPGATSLDKIDEFLSKLENVIIRSSADEIFRSTIASRPSDDSRNRSQSINKALQKLRKEYGK